jgi:hypothetical protein
VTAWFERFELGEAKHDEKVFPADRLVTEVIQDDSHDPGLLRAGSRPRPHGIGFRQNGRNHHCGLMIVRRKHGRVHRLQR